MADRSGSPPSPRDGAGRRSGRSAGRSRRRARGAPAAPTSRHARGAGGVQKASPWPSPRRRPAVPGKPVEAFAADEHRIGLKPIPRRVWAPKGERAPDRPRPPPPRVALRHRLRLTRHRRDLLLVPRRRGIQAVLRGAPRAPRPVRPRGRRRSGSHHCPRARRRRLAHRAGARRPRRDQARPPAALPARAPAGGAPPGRPSTSRPPTAASPPSSRSTPPSPAADASPSTPTRTWSRTELAPTGGRNPSCRTDHPEIV